MKSTFLSLITTTATLALLSGCGGNTSNMGNDPTLTAGLVENAPVADCEAEGCNRPRPTDHLAEQYRTDVAQQQPPAVDPAQAGAIDPAYSGNPPQPGVGQP